MVAVDRPPLPPPLEDLSFLSSLSRVEGRCGREIRGAEMSVSTAAVVAPEALWTLFLL